jgi:hypothetical protein
MSTFDLRSGYHHIDIHPAYQKYLGFEWEGAYYDYTSCPFGLSVSGLIFSKVLRELVKRWRSSGIAIVLYLDNGFITSDSVEDTERAVQIVRQDLIDSGFIINVEGEREVLSFRGEVEPERGMEIATVLQRHLKGTCVREWRG